jgi:AhpD family alkylhydroperoxidase
MTPFTIHSLDNAPENSKPVLRDIQSAFGFIPNIAGAMAGSPALMNGFISVFRNAHAGTLSEAQVQVLLLTNAVTNACEWAVAFHTHLALHHGVAVEDVNAIRDGRLPREPRHAALSGVAKALIEGRGHVDSPRLQSFFDAGFAHEQVLETILVVAASTMTNYAGSVAKPPLERDFQQHAWERPAD